MRLQPRHGGDIARRVQVSFADGTSLARFTRPGQSSLRLESCMRPTRSLPPLDSRPGLVHGDFAAAACCPSPAMKATSSTHRGDAEVDLIGTPLFHSAGTALIDTLRVARGIAAELPETRCELCRLHPLPLQVGPVWRQLCAGASSLPSRRLDCWRRPVGLGPSTEQALPVRTRRTGRQRSRSQSVSSFSTSCAARRASARLERARSSTR